MAEQRKTAVVTGASSGIGRETALRLADRGYRVVLIARRVEALQALADEIGPSDHSLVAPMDLTDATVTNQRFAEVLQDVGHVDVLVNAAGEGLLRAFLDHTENDVNRSMQLHYIAPATLIRLALPGMLGVGAGHVINVASVASRVGPWGHSAYAAAKAALTTLTHTLGTEYGESGVHFSIVHPGIVNTAFFNHSTYSSMSEHISRHAIPPSRVADRIVRLIDRPRRDVFVPGHYRVIDYLKLFLPGLVHGKIARESKPVEPPAKPVDRPAPVQP